MYALQLCCVRLHQQQLVVELAAANNDSSRR
jgi:hypothetical protein